MTAKKLYFHSYFNKGNLFFGNTKLLVPKEDMLKLEKSTNAMIFDNSISIYTSKGKLFFTSFIYRDKAYDKIIQLY